jgi:hypothetical protein
MIFLGTVTEALDKDGDWVRLARVRIDRTYKGVSEKTVTLFDSGMCDGPLLHVGEQYLMYTHDDGSGYLPSRGCTRSRRVQDATEDLIFLNGLAKAPPTGTVFGQVTSRTGSLYSEGEPVPNALVEIVGEGNKLTGSTDGKGRYSFSGLKPGTYSVIADRPGFSQSESESDDPVDVPARSCAEFDVVLRRNWPGTLSGHVTRADSVPGPAGINVDLIRMGGEGNDGKSELLIGSTVQTDENGEYSFHGVAPGVYKVVVNLYKPPVAEDPYRTIYWPAATKEATASTVEVSANGTAQQCDFRLPPPLKSTPVKIAVLLPDGTPAKHAELLIGTQMDGMFEWAGKVLTDESGQSSFGAIEGFTYSVEWVNNAGGRLSSHVKFSEADGWQPMTIRLLPLEN